MNENYANPEEEGQIVLSFLSLLLDCRVRKTGYRINGLDASGHHPPKPAMGGHFERKLDLHSSADSMAQLFTLGDALAKQFIRACNAYSLAIAALELDESLSFLLLVTALECLSSQEEFCPNAELDKQKKSAERYCRLVSEYCTDLERLRPTEGQDAFVRNLKTVYFSHRSGFVHAGREVSIASRIADEAGFQSLSHFVDGKETHTPGLKWFFQVARTTLLGFLANFPRRTTTPNENVLATIAKGRAVLTVRVGAA